MVLVGGVRARRAVGSSESISNVTEAPREGPSELEPSKFFQSVFHESLSGTAGGLADTVVNKAKSCLREL